MFGEPIEVLDIGVTIGEDGAAYPTVVLDASDRPDVADLARVHAVDGLGDIATAAARGENHVLLGVQLTRPVECAFCIHFDLDDHAPLLEDAARVGHLLLATSPPDPQADRHLPWLAIDLDGPRLRALLTGDPT